MEVKEFTFKTQDGITIYCRKWLPKENRTIKGAIQISHGMAEHIKRYDEFAKYLVSEGFIVYGNDHRGHGKTAGSLDNVGYFADEDGWNKVVDDMHTLTRIIKDENENLPIFIIGHSMGSFLTRTYIENYGDEVNGVILSGTGGDPGFIGNIGILIAKSEIKKVGKKGKSKKLNNLSFGNYNSKFKPTRTEFDWLSRDTSVVDKYIEDPYCGSIFSAGFYYDMLTGLKELNKRENIDKIPKNLPVVFLSGDKDPVGDDTKGVLKAYKGYKDAGIVDVSYKFYIGARHEILNEINSEEVYSDIISWINSKIKVANIKA